VGVFVWVYGCVDGWVDPAFLPFVLKNKWENMWILPALPLALSLIHIYTVSDYLSFV
jgi:hypothetical protein